MDNNNVFELYSEAMKAWGRVPKIGAKCDAYVEVGGNLIKLSCPICGTVYAEYYSPPITSWQPDIPIICCGRLLLF